MCALFSCKVSVSFIVRSVPVTSPTVPPYPHSLPSPRHSQKKNLIAWKNAFSYLIIILVYLNKFTKANHSPVHHHKSTIDRSIDRSIDLWKIFRCRLERNKYISIVYINNSSVKQKITQKTKQYQNNQRQ
jgi:hypothetical protein